MRVQMYEKMNEVIAPQYIHKRRQYEIYYRILQNLWARILKRSYKHRTSFICLKLEECELSWSGVRYLLRVLYHANRSLLYHFQGGMEVEVVERLFQHLPVNTFKYCKITSGQVQYPSNK